MSEPHNPPPAPGFTVTAPLPGGATVVASDALLAELDALASLATSLRHSAAQLAEVVAQLGPGASRSYPMPPAASDARRYAQHAVQQLHTASEFASGLGRAVRAALITYEQAEEAVLGVGHAIEEQVAETVGSAFTLFALPLAALGAGGFLLGTTLAGRSPKAFAKELQTFLERHGRILTNPFTVDLIRHLAADADGLGAGLALQPPLQATLRRLAGATGVRSSANAVVGLGREFGLFEPTRVSVRKTSTFEYGSPPTTLAERAASFPNSSEDPNGEQIRIDKYVEPGKPDRFEVWVGGTATFNPITGREPFDFQSDLAGVGGQKTASIEAVEQAMRAAGITATSPVIMNGYSQGGLDVSNIAASGHFNVKGVVTFGAPSAQEHIPASIPVLSVRNSEDLVPATSGFDVNHHAVVVTRDAFAGTSIPSDVVVPAHELDVYQQTAAAVDHSRSSEVRGVLVPINEFGQGATTVVSTLWVATRQPTG